MSKEYAHITVAVDLTEESARVIQKGQRIAERTGAILDVVHTLEPVGVTYGGDMSMDVDTLQQELETHARQGLTRLANELGISEEHQHVLVGQPDVSIKEFTEQQQTDLIVVGSHGRTGLALMLGSTTSTVLRNANCDVLAVKVSNVAEEPFD